MDNFAAMLVYTVGAGACILVGGRVAGIEQIRPSWLEHELRHSVIAFSGGILISAVALVLVPEGTQFASSALGASLMLLSGGLVFFAIERFSGTRRKETPQFSAMLLDYVPESLALGGTFAIGAPAAPLLAILIGLQNLPEGFNAYRELIATSNFSTGKILLLMCSLIPLGPLMGFAGWMNGAEHTVFLGCVMLFASGGILYLNFQDIAPQSRLVRHWAPALGAVHGFGLGMLGKLLTSGG